MASPSFVQESKKVHCSVPGCSRGARCNSFCGKHYQRVRKYGVPILPERTVATWQRCTISGCDNRSRTRLGSFCEMHYCRRYRTGSFDDPNYKRRYVTSHGYVVLSGFKHPIAHRSRGEHYRCYEHRRVLYDAIGPGTHRCHWCIQVISWSAKGKRRLVVDHLDNDKQNNSLSNLVPACHRCNSSRGLFMSWVLKHQNDPFLAKLFAQ